MIQEFVRRFMSLDANPSQRCAILGLQYQSHHPPLLQSWVFYTRVFFPPPHTASNSLYTQFASVSSIWHSANFTSWLLDSFFFPWSKTHPSQGVGISSICSYFLSPWIFALLGWGSPVPSQKSPATLSWNTHLDKKNPKPHPCNLLLSLFLFLSLCVSLSPQLFPKLFLLWQQQLGPVQQQIWIWSSLDPYVW